MHLSKADRNSKASQKETKPKGLLQLPHKYPRREFVQTIAFFATEPGEQGAKFHETGCCGGEHGRKLSLPVSDSFLDNNRPMPWSYRHGAAVPLRSGERSFHRPRLPAAASSSPKGPVKRSASPTCCGHMPAAQKHASR
eukprot:s6912_g4.t1